MNKRLPALCAAAALLICPSVSTAQDIEFMGKNGEKVELRPKTETAPAVPARPKIGVQRAQANHLGLGLGNFGDLNGRTFTVTTPDGGTKEISTDDARSVIINRSFSSVDHDGERQIKQGGTAIIVAADGQQYEIDLSKINDDGPSGKLIEVKKSYMIGAFCEPVPAMMRSQLNLDEGVGLVVKHVQDGSPAAQAGIAQFDILMYADDQLISNLKDLTDVVAEVGAQEQSFSLTIMRGGEDLSVEITPAQRAVTPGLLPGPMPVLGGFEMNDMGPGLIIDHGFDDGMAERMMKVREELERMDGLFKNLDVLEQLDVLIQNEDVLLPKLRKQIAP